MKKKTEAKRQAILNVAKETFQELGFEKTSMSEISSRVGGSKATLYNYFASKEELFFEVMTHLEFDIIHTIALPSAGNIAESLHQFGKRLLAFLYSPEIRAHRHLAITESGRTDLGRIVYERGILRSQNLVSEFLQEAMDQGKLRQTDSIVATRHLIALLESELMDRFLFQIPMEIDEKKIKEVAHRAIEIFIKGYGV
jgi:AcrR family transcriptional regulator